MKSIASDVSNRFDSYSAQNGSVSKVSDGFRPQFAGFSQWVSQAAKAIAQALFGSSEPLIWQTTDRAGNTWWIIDDPLTGNRFHALSEEEVRVWIERHYYAQPTPVESISRQVNPLLIERW